MKTILVIDDELGVSQSLSDLLSEEGYRVLTAWSGQEGMSRIEGYRPDLVILDWNMPVMDGGEVLRQLGLRPQAKDIPVVLMGPVKSLPGPERDRCAALLEKPFTVDALLATVESLIGKGGKG